MTLQNFLAKQLQGSTLTIRAISKQEVSIGSDSSIRIHVMIDDRSKNVNFDLYSPKWSRPITVQQLDGFEFMESQAEEQLLKDNSETIADDTLLAIDMIRIWAAKNNYRTIEVNPTPEEAQTEKASSSESTE